MQESRDVARPNWGPPFLSLGSWPYRVEYAVATVAIFVLLFGWRALILHQFPGIDIVWFVVFLVLPDAVAFIPMAAARPSAGRWPSWGPSVYNVTHSLLTWAAVALVVWLVAGASVWPLFGWAAHITLDRSVGYHLRAPPRPPGPDSA